MAEKWHEELHAHFVNESDTESQNMTRTGQRSVGETLGMPLVVIIYAIVFLSLGYWLLTAAP